MTGHELTQPQRRVLEALDLFGEPNLRTLRANGNRLDVIRRVAEVGLASCTRDTGDDETTYIITAAGYAELHRSAGQQ